MYVTADKELKKIISKSAVKESSIPIIICDANFKVCMRTAGAVKLISKPTVGGSLLAHIHEDTAEKISSGAIPCCAFFDSADGKVFTIVTDGEVRGRQYYAFILEPEISAIPAEVPQYIADSYCRLSDAVAEILASPSVTCTRLEHSITATLRLTDFFEKNGLDTLSAKSGFTDVYSELETVIDEYTELFSTIGAAISFSRLYARSPLCIYPAEILHIFASVLIGTALPLSTDGHLDITCEISPDDSSMARISVGVMTKGEILNVRSFHDFSTRIVPFTLELAAIEDMAEHYGFGLSCDSLENKLNISFDIPVHSSMSIRLNAPIRRVTEAHLRRTVTELFDVAVMARNA